MNVELRVAGARVNLCLGAADSTDDVCVTGTAAEVSPIRSIDRILIGDGNPGTITKQIADEFFGIANGLKPDRFGWLTPVKVAAAEPVNA